MNKQTLLMLIDLQYAIDHPDWGQRNNPEAEKQMVRLLTEWRQRSMPLLHIKHMSVDPTSHYRPGQPGNDFREETKPLPGEEVLEKSSNSAFVGTGLEDTLKARGISDIVIVGVITNNSVEATARMSGNLGFHTTVVLDATYTFGRADFAGAWRTADEVHNMSLANMAGEYAEIRSTDEVLSLMIKGKR